MGLKAPSSFLLLHMYIINMTTKANILTRGARFAMNETGEIVVIPVPSGETVICGSSVNKITNSDWVWSR